jgi:hypothetical protein
MGGERGIIRFAHDPIGGSMQQQANSANAELIMFKHVHSLMWAWLINMFKQKAST